MLYELKTIKTNKNKVTSELVLLLFSGGASLDIWLKSGFLIPCIRLIWFFSMKCLVKVTFSSVQYLLTKRTERIFFFPGKANSLAFVILKYRSGYIFMKSVNKKNHAQIISNLLKCFMTAF